MPDTLKLSQRIQNVIDRKKQGETGPDLAMLMYWKVEAEALEHQVASLKPREPGAT
jgi:hypothetical protein